MPTTDDFDANTANPETVEFAGASPRAGDADGQTHIGFDVMAPDNRIYLPLIKLHLQTRAQAAAYARKRGLHEEEGQVCAFLHKVLIPRSAFY